MGVANVAHIASELIAGGLAADTPAAAIQNASLPSERSIVATLAAVMTAADIGSPAIIVVGTVVRYAAVAVAQSALPETMAMR